MITPSCLILVISAWTSSPADSVVASDAITKDPLTHELKAHGVAVGPTSLIDAALTHHDPEARWMAVDLLGRYGHHEAEKALRTVLRDDEDSLVRRTAALALVRLGHRDALGDARSFLMTSEYLDQQVAIAGELAELGDFYGYRFVTAAASSRDDDRRASSIAALVRFIIGGFVPGKDEPHPEVLLMQLLRDPSATVRQQAIPYIVFAEANGAAIAPYVDTIRKMAAEDPDPKVRETARWQLYAREATRRAREAN